MSQRRVLLLHGAIRNAGDFLIRDRAIALLNSLAPDSQIIPRFRLDPVDDLVPTVDLAVLAGGPALAPDMIPSIHPSVPKLMDHGVPTRLLAVGRSGGGAHEFEPTEATLRALHWLTSDGPISVRDIGTRDAIDRLVPGGACLTGCVAWYDRATLDSPPRSESSVSNIAFTTPAAPRLQKQAIRVLGQLRAGLPGMEFLVSYHRGVVPSPLTGWRQGVAYLAGAATARSWRIPVVSLAGESAGLSRYTDFDMHVGYRVHAHLYFLSLGKPSILIAEDRRGTGQQTTLGDLYRFSAASKDLEQRTLDAVRHELVTFEAFRAAQQIIRDTYPVMEAFVRERIA